MIGHLSPDRISHALTMFQAAHVRHINEPMVTPELSHLSEAELLQCLEERGLRTDGDSREEIEKRLIKDLAPPTEADIRRLEQQVRMVKPGADSSYAEGKLQLEQMKRSNAVLEAQEHWVNQFSKFLAAKRVTVEVCLTSNKQTAPLARPCGMELSTWRDHPFKQMLQAEMSLTLCTDNRTISNTNMMQEVYLAVTEFKLSYVQLRELILNGFTASFMSEGDEEVTRLATHLQHGGTVISRQEYLDQVSAYFDAVAMRYRKRNK